MYDTATATGITNGISIATVEYASQYVNTFSIWNRANELKTLKMQVVQNICSHPHTLRAYRTYQMQYLRLHTIPRKSIGNLEKCTQKDTQCLWIA